jgi:hypothetical protein
MLRIVILGPIHQVGTGGVIEIFVEGERIAMRARTVKFLLGHAPLGRDGRCIGDNSADPDGRWCGSG